MARPINEQVVVLTGASSGIGRATAVELGRRGAKVVMAARSAEELNAAAEEVRAAGGETLVVPTDVADYAQCQRLAQAAVARFGRIDTWVNDAAVSMYARIVDAEVAEIEQVIRVNLLGAIHGMKAALPVLTRQNSGTIVNVGSVLSKFAVPLQGPYCASKHGLLGFADSLRLELKRDGSAVEVVTVMPSSIDTPFFAGARAKLGGKMPQPLPPAYDPRAAADAIVHVCERPQRDVIVGGAGRLFVLLNRLSPALFDWMMLTGDGGAQGQISSHPKEGGDNLMAPTPGAKPAHGGWTKMNLGQSWYTKYWDLNPVGRAVALGALGVAGLGLARWLTARGGDGTPADDPRPDEARVYTSAGVS
ncbi:MAG: SDR family NAD(P)-dependent oxidoreductase [Gemmataceae bacterium]|nr:SDR family NAD(P)-dependent oxidoreductase [Gemmataceae bacterium]